MATFLSNAFALSMLHDGMGISIAHIQRNDAGRLVKLLKPISIVGHAETAAIFSEQLGTEVEFNRKSVKLVPGDQMIVGQYVGPRLPEGCIQLPEGASIQWMRVFVK